MLLVKFNFLLRRSPVNHIAQYTVFIAIARLIGTLPFTYKVPKQIRYPQIVRGMPSYNLNRKTMFHYTIDLYRDVWIAAIASSRTSLATLMGVMCKTSQCELRSLRVNSGMLNVIRIVTYYSLPPLESPDSFWMTMAFSR